MMLLPHRSSLLLRSPLLRLLPWRPTEATKVVAALAAAAFGVALNEALKEHVRKPPTKPARLSGVGFRSAREFQFFHGDRLFASVYAFLRDLFARVFARLFFASFE